MRWRLHGACARRGTGIGLATARELAREGAEVYITGRRKRELDAAAASIGTDLFGVRFGCHALLTGQDCVS